MKPRVSRLAAALALLLPTAAFASCGSAFCTVNTNWTTQSAQAGTGSSFDLRYEYIDQDQPMSGGDKIAVGQVPHHHDEVSTINRNLVATYSRSFGEAWGLTLSAPLGQRKHLHIHNHHGAQLNEQWKFTEAGDARVLGRYQLAALGDPLTPASFGISFGLKLPTGRFTLANDAKARAERSLQPGTGTTDLILGSYYHQRLSASDASWFAQAQYQHALEGRAGYKPGAQLGADVGYRQGVGERFGLLVQMNLLHKGRDSGSEAEPADSGGRYLFLSPGLSYAVGGNLQLYGFYQQPLVRHVNGVQLTAQRALLVGLSGRM
jgi:opacity protein-like surface antigen